MSDHDALTKVNLLRRMDIGWNELQTFLGTLSEPQLTVPTDAAGWTAKDHVIHLALWENTAYALLSGQSQRASMDIDADTWAHGDDAINAVLQKRHRDMPLDEERPVIWWVIGNTMMHSGDHIPWIKAIVG